MHTVGPSNISPLSHLQGVRCSTLQRKTILSMVWLTLNRYQARLCHQASCGHSNCHRVRQENDVANVSSMSSYQLGRGQLSLAGSAVLHRPCG